MWNAMVTSGRFTMNQFVEVNCANPARIFGLYPKKGCLLPGSDADIVLWDPLKEVTYGTAYSQQRTDYNLYEGWNLVGYPIRVISRGKTIVDKGVWQGKAGQGRFVACKPFNEIL
jgi:dihydropyrimidinase